jgi:crotonyl-CoA carboxylase/reductase
MSDRYAIGEIPSPGASPREMHAFVIRRERHGEPEIAMRPEVLPVPEPGPGEVLVQVMAAGVNYNGVWAALGQPLSVLDVHKHDFHIAGSDASGVVWAVGPGVRTCKPGDEVVLHCNQGCGQCEQCVGGEPMHCAEQRIWGYETPWGSFAQFTKVQAQQVLPKPPHLTWEESACYMLTLATAYRMLFGHAPHELRPGQWVLVWGGSGGLGSMAIQLAHHAGAHSIAVVSSPDKASFVTELGADAWINRKDFDCWGRLPDTRDRAAYGGYLRRVREFGKAIWDVTGKRDVDMVFEHPGEETFPVSCLVVKRGGMVVFCAGTTGFNLSMDAAYVWMRQKRIQGSHFASRRQAAEANRLVHEGRIDPCLSRTFEFEATPLPHALMRANQHPGGNMAILVQAPARGLRNLAETLAWQRDHGRGSAAA